MWTPLLLEDGNSCPIPVCWSSVTLETSFGDNSSLVTLVSSDYMKSPFLSIAPSWNLDGQNLTFCSFSSLECGLLVIVAGIACSSTLVWQPWRLGATGHGFKFWTWSGMGGRGSLTCH